MTKYVVRSMIWGFFAASGPGQFAIVQGKTNFQHNFIKVSHKVMSGWLSAS